MEFERCAIPDVVICMPKVFGDDRGYFMETFRQDELESFLGFRLNFCQDNESKSSFGVLRGLHYQMPPYTQTKLVRVTEGKVLDIAVDIRKGSPHFGESVAVELSAENKKQLFVPRGFAHGFVVLSETATFAYKCDNYYMPEYDRGILFNDEALKIDWKISESEMKLSEKDSEQPLLKDAELFDFNNNLYE
ncbi:MAG: dTDP-4-dehydrorhamnose 3,5-epimerase [Zunongwangia sp.]|uniref:dTDP-4-dehydrorhamnose 3,5-epimerase n=1 Tax=Zunongwangia profunda TaxID=398743 RepID=A0A3D5IZ14_9FLAO|nr:dTDP-4-dehydrorhamnose 3,5-epimerase [Zunongwangia profunda]MAB91180.1 dTDP-4-dehydrorhamnose 3,5-epimerase [Planctomycetota bacterium]MAO37983.1 dTDP-4-dehydrorhamnose 3,5-epimerase [Zunongwangia sp.]MAS72468.1 dTDP-4-dehydrorhamnose 3,5-epimerase [Zunongwangia sp.]HCV80286.1 dTDP-4-dehydrorhamnose 3,5-epimerase [Zunongwangia profunda]|tara:strand:- start:8379 stop:8951 length:573 start_codon:yes stop_codon:yes gene_type:complete